MHLPLEQLPVLAKQVDEHRQKQRSTEQQFKLGAHVVVVPYIGGSRHKDYGKKGRIVKVCNEFDYYVVEFDNGDSNTGRAIRSQHDF